MFEARGQVIMSKFDDFITVLRAGVIKLAKDTLKGFETQALSDAQAFVDKARVDLERWTKLLAEGRLSTEEFSDLVQAKRDLAELHALTDAGLAVIKLDEFRTGLMNLVIDTVTKIV
jgi:hypothetical protein